MKNVLKMLLVLGLVSGAFAEAKMQIWLKFEGEKTLVELDENPAARDFYAMLPLKFKMSDYVGKEKITPALPKPLDTSGLRGYEPQVGDLFYFAPWGNVGIFYAKQPFHSGLVRFGRISREFLAKIKAQKNDFEMSFERAE